MASEAPTPSEGSLERLHISVSTTAPDDLLTPNAVRAARFRKSKPWGLLEQDVKDFQEIVTAAVAWYIDKLHQRDTDVHKLGKELDARDTQIANLNLQLASAQYNSGVKEAIDRNEEDKEMSDLLARVASLQADLGTTEQLLHQRELQNESLAAELVAVQTAAPVIEQAAPTAPAVDEATAQALVAAQVQVQELEVTNKSLEAFIDQQESYIDTLLTQLQVADDTTPEAPAADDDLTAADDATYADDTPDEVSPDAEDEDVYAAEDIDLDDDPELALHPYEAPAAPYAADSVEEADEPVEAPQAPTAALEPRQVPVTETAPEQYIYNGIKLPPGIRPEDL